MSKKTRARRPRRARGDGVAPAGRVQNTQRPETGLVVRSAPSTAGTEQENTLAPPTVIPGPSGMYVKLPLSPELLAAAQKYVDMGRQIAAVFLDANASARTFMGALERAASEVERDVARIKKQRRRRRA